MIDVFMKSPQSNALALIVLIALIITWISSLALNLRNIPIPVDQGWYAKLLPIFTFLGIPATIDLLQTKGISLVFAFLVLVVFILNIFIPILQLTRKSSHLFVNSWYRWSILISAIGGLAVTTYLTFIEASGAPIVCGPSGGCSDVLQSRYATLFDILPVGTLGLIGYIAILLGWIAWHYGPDIIQKWAVLSIWGMCVFGVLFSIYLTFLEPFVIGATCMWCISSAVLMIILLLASTPAAQPALAIDDE